jgi:uncharacterized RDD family membrane protein YckC
MHDLEPATWSRRFAASILDSCIVTAVTWALLLAAIGMMPGHLLHGRAPASATHVYPGIDSAAAQRTIAGMAFFDVWWIYHVAFGALGVTPGMTVAGVRVVRLDRARRPGIVRSFDRFAAGMLGAAALGAGFVVGLRDPARRTFADRSSEVVVVRAGRR